MTSKRFAEALSRRVSRSKSAKKGRSSDSGLNPDARTFRLSYSKSSQKDGSSESVLNPGVRTFRPRQFRDGNNSTSFSEEKPTVLGNYLGSAAGGTLKQNGPRSLENNDNDSTTSTGKAMFQLRRKWTGHGPKTLDASDDLVVDNEEVIVHDSGGVHVEEPDAFVNGVEQCKVKTTPGNICRRQTASEPFLDNPSEEDDWDDSAVDANIMHSARYSRLPQISRGRAVSAIERKAAKGQMSGEGTPHENELQAPVNTAATSPGILTPRSNGKVDDASSP